MRLRALALLAATTSCDIFGPGGPSPVAVELPLCDPFPITLTWAAVKTQGSDWRYLTVTDGRATVSASSALTIAYGNSRDTRVYSAAADELRGLSCPPRKSDSKFLDGSVRDVAADEQFFVTVGATPVFVSPFTVFVPEGPLDVVARTANKATGVPQRIILRHGVNLPVGAEIPILDFGSAEPRAFESANITVNGFAVSGAYFSNLWVGRVRHDLFLGPLGQSPVRYYAVPSSLLGPDDYHTFEVRAFTNSAERRLAYYYRSARETQVALGPEASAPMGSVLASTPCTRLQARVPAQPEYPSFVIVNLQVDYGNAGNNLLEIGVTRDFLGEMPSTWTLEVPDLKRPDGSCLLAPSPASWFIQSTTSDGRIALHLGAKARDGEVRRWSSAFMDAGAAAVPLRRSLRAGAPAPPETPRAP